MNEYIKLLTHVRPRVMMRYEKSMMSLLETERFWALGCPEPILIKPFYQASGTVSALERRIEKFQSRCLRKSQLQSKAAGDHRRRNEALLIDWFPSQHAGMAVVAAAAVVVAHTSVTTPPPRQRFAAARPWPSKDARMPHAAHTVLRARRLQQAAPERSTVSHCSKFPEHLRISLGKKMAAVWSQLKVTACTTPSQRSFRDGDGGGGAACEAEPPPRPRRPRSRFRFRRPSPPPPPPLLRSFCAERKGGSRDWNARRGATPGGDGARRRRGGRRCRGIERARGPPLHPTLPLACRRRRRRSLVIVADAVATAAPPPPRIAGRRLPRRCGPLAERRWRGADAARCIRRQRRAARQWYALLRGGGESAGAAAGRGGAGRGGSGGDGAEAAAATAAAVRAWPRPGGPAFAPRADPAPSTAPFPVSARVVAWSRSESSAPPPRESAACVTRQSGVAAARRRTRPGFAMYRLNFYESTCLRCGHTVYRWTASGRSRDFTFFHSGCFKCAVCAPSSPSRRTTTTSTARRTRRCTAAATCQDRAGPPGRSAVGIRCALNVPRSGTVQRAEIRGSGLRGPSTRTRWASDRT
ncbi:SFRICE_001019 [Gryllus bimaculatus]|nr:SFRICE_001019 [Gryllus bimaculatus]